MSRALGAPSSKVMNPRIFVGGRGRHDQPNPDLMVFGYIRPEADHWVAVCVNLSLVAQGGEAREALEKLVISMESYIHYIQTKHPEDWDERLSLIDCPEEFLDEFKEIVGQHEALAKCGVTRKSTRKTTRKKAPTVTPGFTFAQPISATYAT